MMWSWYYDIVRWSLEVLSAASNHIQVKAAFVDLLLSHARLPPPAPSLRF
jgi:hypothetical protein